MNFRQRLNPRLHLAAAIGWAVFSVVAAAALITAYLAANEAEQRARADAEALLVEFATEVRDALSLQLNTRRSLLKATAAQLRASGDRNPVAMRQTLLAVQSGFPEFVWMGVVEPGGHTLADTGDGPSPAPATGARWVARGPQEPFVSDPHGPGPQVIDATMPLDLTGHQGSGVLATQLSWTWVQGLLERMQQALDPNRHLELMLVDRDGLVLLGPADWRGQRLGAANDASELGRYVTGSRTRLRLAENLGLGWTVMVRQSADQALAPARRIGRTVFLTVLLAGLLSALAAAFVTRLLTRRLSDLARDAEAVRRGQQRALANPAGADEVSRIGATLSQLVDQLQQDKQALQQLNTELDSRVAERTARIERMADEARHAAVVRERLRLARDLHDTLAHSLMALLTQIRLIRKLHARLPAPELEAELDRAEEVATTGLAGARAAIGQMRGHGVREEGLGPTLQAMAQRFGERTGVAVALQIDPAAAAWADERAERVVRITEEALRNVERHAQARQVGLTLSGAGPDGRARLQITDDGQGFEPGLPRPGHFGLQGMHEQAALMGATLVVHSTPGQGTRLLLAFDP
jgi:signal transduction histidine kinase